MLNPCFYQPSKGTPVTDQDVGGDGSIGADKKHRFPWSRGERDPPPKANALCLTQVRNTVVNLLNDWGLVHVENAAEPSAPLSQIKVISFREKNDWMLEAKYNIGKKREN